MSAAEIAKEMAVSMQGVQIDDPDAELFVRQNAHHFAVKASQMLNASKVHLTGDYDLIGRIAWGMSLDELKAEDAEDRVASHFGESQVSRLACLPFYRDMIRAVLDYRVVTRRG